MKQLLLAPIVVLFAGSIACSGAPLAPKVTEAIAVAECQLDAVKALVPHVETAEAVVAAARVQDFGRAAALLAGLGMAQEDIEAVAKAFDACLPQPEPSDGGIVVEPA